MKASTTKRGRRARRCVVGSVGLVFVALAGACGEGGTSGDAAGAGAPQKPGFVERAAECGVTFKMSFLPGEQGDPFKINLYDHGAGVVVTDYDQDGDDDVFFLNQLGPNALFRNDGVPPGSPAGLPKFTDVTGRSAIGLSDRICVAACFADVDADGDEDVYVTSTRGGNVMFRNDGGDSFTDVTAEAGLTLVGHTQQPCFFDADGDGDLDLFVTATAHWTTDVRNASGRYFEGYADLASLSSSPPEKCRLWRNDGDWRFTDVTDESGVGGNGWFADVSLLDYDTDGDLDLVLANMFGGSGILRNDGGRFTDVTRAVFGNTSYGSVGTRVFDYDGDGRLDVLFLDMHSDMWVGPEIKAAEIEPSVRYEGPEGPTVARGTMTPTERDIVRSLLKVPVGQTVFGSTLFRARGDGTFEETGLRAKVETWWPWGAATADFDLDGDEDIYIPAGMGYPFLHWPSSYLVNDGRGVFADGARDAGLEPLPGGDIHPVKIAKKPAAKSVRSAAVGDFDGDGRPDLVANHFNDRAHLWMNRFAPRNWIGLRLRGAKASRSAIGAVATIRSGGRTLVRDVQSVGGYLAQSSRTLRFGLADDGAPLTVEIRWPGGATETIRDLAPGRVHDIVQTSK